jgi:hypothetical protein
LRADPEHIAITDGLFSEYCQSFSLNSTRGIYCQPEVSICTYFGISNSLIACLFARHAFTELLGVCLGKYARYQPWRQEMNQSYVRGWERDYKYASNLDRKWQDLSSPRWPRVYHVIPNHCTFRPTWPCDISFRIHAKAPVTPDHVHQTRHCPAWILHVRKLEGRGGILS